MCGHLSLQPLIVKVNLTTIVTTVNIDHLRVLCQGRLTSSFFVTEIFSY